MNMSNIVFYNLEVLKKDAEELSPIVDRLKQPSTELVKSVAFQSAIDTPIDVLARNIGELVGFEAIEDFDCPGIHKFSNSSKRGHGLILHHLLDVSKQFPTAIFLLDYHDPQASYSGKTVIRAGKVVQGLYDDYHRSQALDWLLFDIFAPFRAEHYEDLEFGSLWKEWLDDIATGVQLLRCRTNGDVAEAERRANELSERNTRFIAMQWEKLAPLLEKHEAASNSGQTPMPEALPAGETGQASND
jgi:hypothetical protein